MKTWLKGALIGVGIGIVLLIISYILPLFICPDFFRTGPSYPTDQLVCSLLINNPLRVHYPFPKIFLVWIPWTLATMIIGAVIGLIYDKSKKRKR